MTAKFAEEISKILREFNSVLIFDYSETEFIIHCVAVKQNVVLYPEKLHLKHLLSAYRE